MLSSIAKLYKQPLAKIDDKVNNSELLESEEEEHIKEVEEEHHETNLLEKTLLKLTSLVQIGLGEAGSRMIKKCLDISNNNNLNPLVDGTRILAIFGFCDIRQFTYATECLKEEVMMYVNSIANIVHNQITNHLGYPNKNIGDAFLIVWRFHNHIKQDDLNILKKLQQQTANVDEQEGLKIGDQQGLGGDQQGLATLKADSEGLLRRWLKRPLRRRLGEKKWLTVK